MQCARLGEKAARESGFLEMFGEPFDLDHGLNVLLTLLREPHCVLLVAELGKGHIIGVIAGVVIVAPFAPKATLGHELFVYVDRQHRKGTRAGLLLIKAFEQAMIEKGAKALELGSNSTFTRVEKLYERMGYKLISRYYTRVV